MNAAEAAYEAANQLHRDFCNTFLFPSREAYRAGKITDADFLAIQAEHKALLRACDAAEAALS